jgi:glucosamine kinase
MTAGPGALLFGLDAGGTRTRALLAGRGGETFWRGEGGAASPSRVGLTEAAEVVAHLWRQACAARPDAPRLLEGVGAGFAGARSPAIQHALRGALTPLFRCPVSPAGVPVMITHDAETALLGAHGPEGAAAVVISGTGSVSLVRDPSGNLALSGGWGWPLGDEGSAVWLGLEALRRALLAWEGGYPDELTGTVLTAWGLRPAEEEEPHALMRAAVAARSEPERFGRLAPPVMALAAAGHPAAVELATRTGRELGRLVAEGCRRLGLPAGTPLPVSLLGGLGEHWGALLKDPLREGAWEWGEGLRLVLPRHGPAQGAVRLAARGAGLPDPWFGETGQPGG